MTENPKTNLVPKTTGAVMIVGGNIIHLDQHVDSEQNVFFMRVEWEEATFSIPREKMESN